MSHLTIAYFTSRKEPMLNWFFDSLHRETRGDYDSVRVVIVDHWFHDRFNLWVNAHAMDYYVTRIEGAGGKVLAGPPKPTVWQGQHRRTKVNWFAAANARNTALCLAPDGWIAFVDDVSVLMPGWLSAVRRAMHGPQNQITCGAYRKVLNLQVGDDDANTITYDDHPGGHDNRMAHVTGDGLFPCHGQWMYGCSLAAPVDAFLQINGYAEAWCDGMGFEDCIAGIMLQKHGYSFVYDRSMLTLESEELHHQLPVMKRSDYGVSPNDKSHAVLHAATHGDGWHPNYFGDEGLRGLRQRVLAGEPFPVCRIPEHEWFTGTPLEDLT